jgi:glycosyltransferase involved in cell wall biosynthesis
MVGQMQQLGHDPWVVAFNVSGDVRNDHVVSVEAHRANRSVGQRLIDSVVCRLSQRYWNETRWSVPLKSAVRQVVRSAGVQLIETEEVRGFAADIAESVDVPMVLRLHGPWFAVGSALGEAEDEEFHRRVQRERRAIEAAAMITAPSQDVLNRVRTYYQLQLPGAAVIPNAVEPVMLPDRWRLDDCEPGHVLFIGRFDRCKGGDTIIDAMRLLMAREESVRFTFVGPDRGLSDGRRRWGLDVFLADRFPDPAARRRIEVLGPQPHEKLAALRRKAHVVVVPSRYEVFGLTAAEAAAMGCPLVASRIGGLAEIVQHGLNGLLAEAGDPADFADKILRLLRDPGLSVRLGRRAAEDAACRYHPRVIAEQTAEVYRRVLAGRLTHAAGADGR